ncbi:hypothetical protein [Psychroserpens sp.]|uniref:hypothetical protein n=1 Tax=Psychroserpens sp. TaxID=2020870 RepID=UPI002B26C5ED|nr:hypothetical protein [Psychroserpens sp.]
MKENHKTDHKKKGNHSHDSSHHQEDEDLEKHKKKVKRKEEAKHRSLHKNHDKLHGDNNNLEYGNRRLFYTTLVIGNWRKQIPHYYRRIIIANALNTSVKDKKFNIYGYLITSKRVFLILGCNPSKIENKLESLEKNLSLEIEHYHIKIETNHNRSHDDDYKVKKFVFGVLFEMYPLYNESLVRLLTGRKPKISYYDSQTAKMEDIIQNYEFSSVLDYNAFKMSEEMIHQRKRDDALVGSAVIVKLRKKSFWKRHKELFKYQETRTL